MDPGFEAFAQARLGQLLAFGWRLTGDPHQAEDLVQEALARTCLRWRHVRRTDRPEVYVQAAMARLHVDAWRRTRLEDLGPALPEPTVPARDHDAALDLREALAALAPGQRAVLVLRYYADWTEAQTAQALGVSVGTVKSQSSDAMRRLRSLLQDEGRPS